MALILPDNYPTTNKGQRQMDNGNCIRPRYLHQNNPVPSLLLYLVFYNLLKPCAKGNTVQTSADGPTKGLQILKTIKKKRFEETVEKALMDQGKNFVRLSITKKLTCFNNTMKTKKESTNSEFDVDFGKFLKKKLLQPWT
jgi:hypothetical protein